MPDTPSLQFDFTSTAAPVQAEGSVQGCPFYFRARNEEWEFTVAERAGDEPAMLEPEDAASGRAWYRSGVVPGGSFAASYLSLDQASAIIHECAEAYFREHA